MDKQDLLKGISVAPTVAGGTACVPGTRVYVATILDGLAEGLTPEQIVDHYPQLGREDIRAASEYAVRPTPPGAA